jgi:Ca-activated chloride channel family protein
MLKAAPDGGISLTVPTAFLSTNGGGLFVALAKAQDAAFLPEPSLGPADKLLDIKLDYVRAVDGQAAGDVLAVAAVGAAPSDGLRRSRPRATEFLIARSKPRRRVSSGGDEEGRYQALRRWTRHWKADLDPRLAPKGSLGDRLAAVDSTAFLSALGSEDRPGRAI